MREVSCRALNPFFQAADRRRIPRSELIAGMSRRLKQYEAKGERIDWDEFLQFIHNVRKHFTLDDIAEIGAVGLDEPGFRSFALIGRTLFSATGLYRWMLTSGGMGNQMFANMAPSFRELGPGQLELDLQTSPGYAECPEFFYMAMGGFKAMPHVLGLSEATVSMRPIERGARYLITYPETGSRRAKVLRWFTRKSDARATAKELDEAIVLVEHQRDVLELAYRLGQRIANTRDVARILDDSAATVGAQTGIAGVRVRSGDHAAHAGATAGTPAATASLPEGMLEIWAVDATTASTLANVLAPTIGLALDNARAYLELSVYQTSLEKLVAQRTEELAVTIEQLKEAQGARQKFFGNISHEFRTPLSLVILAAGDIEQRAGDALDARAKQSLVAVTDAARRLLRLVDELLLLAAGQENKLVLHRAPSDVAAILRSLFGGWQPAAERAGLTLTATLPEQLVALVDPVAIERIASNLISNAVKYTPAGGSVDLVLVDEADGPRLSVLDTGKGIDADLAQRLFGRFERSATANQQAVGTGIGLSLVKQLVEAHGGTIVALPRTGGGTEMRAQFPEEVRSSLAAEAHAPKLVQTGEIPKIRSGQVYPARGLSQGTILVAEDDPNLAERIAELLSESYKVVVGLDGEAALALVGPHQPQLLITDVEMPKMNGIELAREFRKTTNDKLAPIVILSAVNDLGTRVAGLDAGAVDYVGKPFDPRELEARVRSQFRMRELAVRLHRAEQVSTLGILTSGLAHELRNPANGIINAIQPIKEMLPVDVSPGVTALMEVMQDCAEQIGFMSRQLLGFRGGSVLELQPARTTDLVSRSASLAQRALAGVELRTHLVLERSVMCAPHLMVQVLTNLVENGAHAAGKGGWVEVRVARSSDTRATIFEVSDSGGGVPIALRDQIFEPFFTTKPQGVGTGLGLSVARAIIERHHGKIDVRERGERTAFVIELPDSKTA